MYNVLKNTRLNKILFTTLFVSLIFVFCATDVLGRTGNLITNGDASQGMANWNKGADIPFGTIQIPAIPFWFPEGTAIFYSGPSSHVYGNSAYQDVDVSPYEDAIKTGSVTARFSGRLSGEPSEGDKVQLKMQFFNESGEMIGEFHTTPTNDGSWNTHLLIQKVPRDTVKIRVWMDGVPVNTADDPPDAQDSKNDGFFDDLSLKLDMPKIEVSPPDPDFGPIYVVAEGNGAEAYNQTKSGTFEVKNVGDTDTVLTWTLTSSGTHSLGRWTLYSKVKGEVTAGRSPDVVTIFLVPEAAGSRAGGPPLFVTSNASNKEPEPEFTLNATAYDVSSGLAFVSPSIANGKVNVAPGRSVEFTATPNITPLFPGATIEFYEWQFQAKGAPPDPNKYEKTTTNTKRFIFPDLGEYTVYCRVVDSNNVADATPIQIPVFVQKPPKVFETPPQSALDIIGSVDWYSNRYVGIIGEPIRLKADGTSEDSPIEKFIWEVDGDKLFGGANEVQSPGGTITPVFNSPSLTGTIKCKAVSLNGVESDEQSFNIKVYDSLQVDSEGPYTGKAQTPVKLKGSINIAGYPGAGVTYSWKVYGDSAGSNLLGTLKADNNGRAEFTWNRDATYKAVFLAKVKTSEGLEIVGSDETTVTIDSGKPIALPGGPYRGGIFGGNFSPVQFGGNPPNFVQDEAVGKIAKWEWTFGAEQTVGTSDRNIWNPTRAYAEPGAYTATLKVTSEFGRESDPKETTITVIVGSIEGVVRAADLRTPVLSARMTLTSSHVDKNVLAGIADADPNDSLQKDADGTIYTVTDNKGFYAFRGLPLGSYQVKASKENGLVHEFEENPRGTELTLDAPNTRALDFVDISVFPVGGQITYAVETAKPEVFVDGVVLKAFPVGSVSFIESSPSSRTLLSGTSKNYSIPLFSGKYLFLAEKGGHDIRVNTDTLGFAPVDPNEPDAGGLINIEEARSDVDFTDYTAHKVTVFVEDSGGFKIDTYQGNKILAQVNGINGFAEGEVVEMGVTVFETLVPPGKYTVKLPNVPTAVVKSDKTKKEAEVDVTTGDGSVTMVVPVPIVLEIGPNPRLFNLPPDVLSKLGISASDNPENFMFYFPPDLQKHTYTIRATANGNPVDAFALTVTDNISQISAAPAPTQTFPGPSDDRYQGTDNPSVVEYTIIAGLPNKTVVDESDPNSYLEATLPDGTRVKVPRVLPKTITFQAQKDGYAPSQLYSPEVTVLGDVAEGSVSELVAVPNVNYFVLHDPPGDGSYSYLEDSMRIKGVLTDVTMKAQDREIRVYPSPWSAERKIDDVNFDAIKGGAKDLGDKGILGYRHAGETYMAYLPAAGIEVVLGAVIVVTGSVGYAIQLVKTAVTTGVMAGTEMLVQYEISPNRRLETPSGDELPDVMGPGKGDVYYGEGWTIGLQTKHRFSIIQEGGQWIPRTELILTYDLLERNNQYVYTIRDIERIITDLELQISALGNPTEQEKKDEKEKLESAKGTWENLLRKNPAYVWQQEHIQSGGDADRKALDEFLKEKFSDQTGELLIFSGGPPFEYSRTISEANLIEFSTEISVGTQASMSNGINVAAGFKAFGSGVTIEFEAGAEASISSSQNFSRSVESGTESEQTVGFVLQDDEVGDTVSTYAYTGPWGTPIFFTDPGSVTSDPWQAGTNKGVDVQLTPISPVNNGPFDYRDGAHYRFRITSTGKRKLEGTGVNFIFYDHPVTNSRSATVKFNGSDEAPYKMELFKGFSRDDISGEITDGDNIQMPSSTIIVSVYPPQEDWVLSEEREYPVLVQADSESDGQISLNKMLRPRFADLRSPRAIISAPYNDERISPAVFTGEEPFKIEVLTDDHDLARIQLELRRKKINGVWEPWQILSGMVWEDRAVYSEATNYNVTVVTHSDRVPQRREFTFTWTGTQIYQLGEGEYAVRAVGSDKASRLSTDGVTQVLTPNVDLDAFPITFIVDGTKPTVLTTVPFYQNQESERIYKEELSVTFTDDMRADDFTDRTFYITDLLDGGSQVAGFVSYVPASRKALFVPVVPFKPNTFYKALIKTDTVKADGSIELGLHDQAGNPLDQEFSWTFRTKDSPFEEIWSIVFSATDGTSKDGNNIAAVAFNGLDGEDEIDARAIRPLTQESFRLVFVNQDVEYERDIRNADGRLSHHWFFAIEGAKGGASVTITWELSINLTRDTREYQMIQLVEFDKDGKVKNVIPMVPAGGQVGSYTYTSGDTKPHYFRIDVQKAPSLVAKNIEKGPTGWIFFSVPVTPQIAEPFINLGDDINPFQLYEYVTQTGGYNIYPADRWDVALQTAHGYFTRIPDNVEMDVGGALNLEDKALSLETPGWHAIGNPFILPVEVKNLQFTQGSTTKNFEKAAKDGWIEDRLYWWDAKKGADGYHDVVAKSDKLEPWLGYWLKTKVANLTLTIPAPSGVAQAQPEPPDSLQPPKAPEIPKPLALLGEGNQGFDLRLALMSNFALDVTTMLGTRPDAKVGYDALDTSEPPTLSGTVAVYFDHEDWDENAGRYNADYQPILKAGETRTWRMVVFTDTRGARMRLSWEDTIGQLPDDTMFYFRRADINSDWQDLRVVREVELMADARLTKIPFEVRATRFEMSPPRDVSVVAGEGQVEIRWAADSNPFIDGYIIERERIEDRETRRFELAPTHQFVDRNVVEEMTYTYQIAVRFKTGAELKSNLLTVTVLPVVKETVLLQNYPNPFNPETWLPYELEKVADVTIEIYNVSGKLIRTLPLGQKPRGRYTSKEKAAYWDGRTEFGERAASGVYFYVLKTGDYAATRKMILVK